MRIVGFVAAALMASGLAGCFTAEKALLNDANSVAPYGKITFKETTSTDTTIVTRSGKSYSWKTGDGTVTMRFAATDRPNWYVVEMAGPPDPTSSAPSLLYGVVHVDPMQKKAYAFKTIADAAKDAGPGLRVCMNDLICIDDIKAYATAAEKYADSGAMPDTTYDIVLEN